MKNVIVRLNEYLKHASGAEKGIIEFILHDPKVIVGLTIHECAKASYTSPSSVVRLCRKLGFDGYKEFHQSLVYELALLDLDLKEKSKEITFQDSLHDIIEKVTSKNILSLDNTAKLMDDNTVKACVDLMLQSRSICLFGMGASLLVAKDAYLKFLRINKPCIINDDWHAQLLQARNMISEDLAIAISYSGMTKEVIECIKAAKEKGAKVIAITRFEDNPLAKLADYNLSVSATEFIFRSGAMSSRIAQLNIIDILYAAYVNQHFDDSLKQLKMTHIDKSTQE
ncbi:MAG: MurR/RpiR family transcriptional regulator [Erysipelothrix sp.]|jgi:DNA-binding MurR/RpiR family transcriptional regulator|nr:MurR/RpiR family transcriptional regulator [Erysipelothrix sp.]